MAPGYDLGVGRVVLRPVAEIAVGGSLAYDSSDSLRWGAEANLDHRGATVGVNLDLVPQRIRLLVNGANRASGAAQRHAHALIAQLQARFQRFLSATDSMC